VSEQTGTPEIERLERFVGEWEMEVAFSGSPPMGGAKTTFEWMPGKRLLVQRWEIPIPEAPDGLAVYGYDEGRQTLLQHYFDTRGVVRVYEMTLDDGSWKLERNKEDFSPLDFSQRFTGTFSDDGKTIEGTWEIAHDHATYEKDFDITYRKIA
jgi:hypothetical protein